MTAPSREWVTIPGPRQGTQAVADRRDVPHVVVALHLRPGLPGCAHRARARADAGLLLLRRARVGEEGQGARREAGQAPRRRRVAVQVGRPEEGRVGERGQGRVAHAAAPGRVRVPQPPRLRGRARLRVAPARDEHRPAFRRDQAHRVLAASAAHLRPRRGRRLLRSPRCSPSSAATVGAKAAKSSRGGARKRPRRSPRTSPCTARWRPSCG